MSKHHSAEEKNDLKKRFLEVYEQHSDALFRFSYYKLSDREKAKDVVQDTFVKVWEYLSAEGEIKNIKALMYKIASNAIIDNYRKKKESSLDLLLEDGFDPAEEGGAEHMIDKVNGSLALKLLSQLDESLQEILLMRYVDGLSVQEIAEIHDERENTISVKIHRALKELNELFVTEDERTAFKTVITKADKGAQPKRKEA